MSFNFNVSTNALFGAGKLNELHNQINSPMGTIHTKKALVVISNGQSTKANGYLQRLENELQLAQVDYVIYDQVSANSTKDIVEKGGKIAKENECDLIVALGGGKMKKNEF